MSDEIVRRLRNRDAKSLRALKESMPIHGINEEDEDIEKKKKALIDDEELDIPDNEEEEIPNEEEIEAEDTPPEEFSDEEEESGEDGDIESSTPEEEEPEKYVNPLDNDYAVSYPLGQEVSLAFNNGTNSKIKGIIEGYDKEGFYRIKWGNGMTTNGFTDLALSSMTNPKESKCVCGHDEFVTENSHLVCDRCGRRVRESTDPLTKADKSRPKGKKLIRSEAHPVSTSIGESIRKAFTKKINEDIEEDVFEDLYKLAGEFWTRLPELVEDIEALGYTVDEHNNEYVVVSTEDEDGEDHGILIPIGGTSRTITLDMDRARKL